MASILINDPSKISFIVPPGLVTGTYTLSISTWYSGTGAALKEPRSYTFEYELAVVSA